MRQFTARKFTTARAPEMSPFFRLLYNVDFKSRISRHVPDTMRIHKNMFL